MAADFLVRFCEGRDCMDKQQREYIHHLMLQYSDAMVRLTYRRVGDWHLAEDLVQETFLTACCKSERVCGHKKPVAWLFETLNNLTLRESRRFYHTEVSIEDIAESHELTELPMTCHIPMGLSALEQEIILLRIDKGHSFLELAEHFGISEMACRQRLSRALRKCRTLMEDSLGSTPKQLSNYCHKTDTSGDEIVKGVMKCWVASIPINLLSGESEQILLPRPSRKNLTCSF